MPARRPLLALGLALAGALLHPAAARAQGSPAAPPAASPAAGASVDTVKMALVRQLIERSRTAEQMLTVMEAAMPSQRAASPGIPAVFWDRFLVEARARQGELVDMIGEIWARHFTTDDLRQLLAFYDTPLGRKLLATQPVIAQESMLAGQQWGQRIGMAVGAKLEAEGHRVP